MKFTDAKVEEYYVLKKCPSTSDYVVGKNGQAERGYSGRDLRKGTFLICTGVTEDGNYRGKKSTYVRVNENGDKIKKYQNYTYTFHYHSSLKSSDNIKYKGMSDRGMRAAKLRESITVKKAEALDLKKKFEALEADIIEEKRMASNLERFTSDAEELAHTFSKIIKTGGDEKSILQILQNRASTENM